MTLPRCVPLSLQKKQQKKLEHESRVKEMKNLKIQKEQELSSYAYEQGKKY